MNNLPKPKHPRASALPVAETLCQILAPFTTRIQIAGSLRRGKAEVGDIEICYIPIFKPYPKDLFGAVEPINLADREINRLMEGWGGGELSILTKRPRQDGSYTWGEKNKLAIHHPSEIPVDLFSTTEECWFNYLVCRTGSKETNMRIATAAQALGLKWNPYGCGFTDLCGRFGRPGSMIPMRSEQEVFAAVNLPYLEPEQR